MLKVLAQQRPHKYLKFPGRAQAVAAFFGLFNPFNKFDLLSWNDPLPGLLELPLIIRKFWQKKKAAKIRTAEVQYQAAEMEED
jgi:hypothetical protein